MSEPNTNLSTVISLPSLIDPTALSADRPSAVREGVQKLIEVGGRVEILAGELLLEIQEKDYWKGFTFTNKDGTEGKFTTFDDYLDQECASFGQRKAYYLIAIYKKFVRELKIPIEMLRDLSWSKAKEIVPIISESNWKDLLAVLPKITVKEVQNMVAVITGKTTMSETPKLADTSAKSVVAETPAAMPTAVGETESGDMVTLSFTLFKPQAENLKDALKVAGFESASDKPGHLLDMIATDFLASRSAETGDRVFAICHRLERHIASLERSFGVKLEVVGVTTLDKGEGSEATAEPVPAPAEPVPAPAEAPVEPPPA
jgi:hypothetical protein